MKRWIPAVLFLLLAVMATTRNAMPADSIAAAFPKDDFALKIITRLKLKAIR